MQKTVSQPTTIERLQPKHFFHRYVGSHADAANGRAACGIVHHHDRVQFALGLVNMKNFLWTQIIAIGFDDEGSGHGCPSRFGPG